MAERDPRWWRGWLALAFGAAALSFTRLRGGLGVWVDLHRWLHECGVPYAVRNLDGSLVLVLTALLGARLASGRGEALRVLGLRGGLGTGLWFGCVAGAPMFVQAAFAGHGADLSGGVLLGAVVAPFVEELFFRGLLVTVPTRLGSAPFWPLAMAAGAVFGLLHVDWEQTFDAGTALTVLVTLAGGLWLAWLCRALCWNLWATIVLHAVMNAGWLVFDVPGGAVGGLWANVGRTVTIALGTVLALRWRRRHTI